MRAYLGLVSQAINVSMIKFKGRSSLKQYMPKMPMKRDYKVWMRCNESGFRCQFKIFAGQVKDVEKKLGERVVKSLSEKSESSSPSSLRGRELKSFASFRRSILPGEENNEREKKNPPKILDTCPPFSLPSELNQINRANKTRNKFQKETEGPKKRIAQAKRYEIFSFSDFLHCM
ncbi:piggyBac transposable element-derived protein 4 [Nephila pilipes]|uniref:PiggyBac transposable element-derived protein 4 n=1 Tax=Nephila pilipes TaxID=299642 RepID=A0A8X6TYW8_NEPPI|nr:piggyBac transposable element-derived protein 4 [Nephila pilipes]